MSIASALSAVAATVAAVLAGLNLLVTGRRENRRWAREVATEAFVAYLHASFDAGSACREMVELDATDPEDAERFHELQRRIDAAHDTQMQNLTRLRLVSTLDVVEAAHQVHELDHEVIGATLAESPDYEVDEVRGRLRLARRRMVSASRRAIGLPDPSGTSTAGL